MNLITLFEYIGLFVFAASGAIRAMEKKMDLFGILILATVTAIGGGVIRDVVTDIGIPVFFSNFQYLLVIMIATYSVIILRGEIRWRNSFLILDALGLAVFTVAAGMKAIESNYNFMTFLFVSVITAVGGGVIRDILAQEVPMILRREVYAVASLIGAICLWFIHPILGMTISSYLCLGLTFFIRLITLYYHIELPYADQEDIHF